MIVMGSILVTTTGGVILYVKCFLTVYVCIYVYCNNIMWFICDSYTYPSCDNIIMCLCDVCGDHNFQINNFGFCIISVP